MKTSTWQNIRLKEICLEKEGLKRGPFGSAIKKEFFVPDGYKVYEQANAIYDDATRGKYFISEAKYIELENFMVKEGDFIVSCSGTLGRISQIPKGAKPGIINQALLRIRLKNGIVLNKYFLYYFRSSFFQRKIFEESQGTAMSNLIGIKDFKEIEVPIPSIEEQENLVSKIEELFSELDKSIEQLKTTQQQLKVYRQSVLKSGFYGELTKEWRNNQRNLSSGEDLVNEIKKIRCDAHNKKVKETKQQGSSKPKKPFNLNEETDYLDGLLSEEELPESWNVVPLVFVSGNNADAIVDGPFGSSVDVKKDYVGKGVPVVRMVNVRPFRFVKDDLKFIKEEKFEKLKRHNILSGDVLIAKVGATIGDCCIYPNNEPEGMLSTTGSCRIRVDQSIITNKFVEYYIFFQKNNLKKIASQTAQPFLNMKMVKSFPIVLPSLKEQRQIISVLESRLSVADKLEETITNSLQQAEALRQSILKKAFEGKLLEQKYEEDLPDMNAAKSKL